MTNQVLIVDDEVNVLNALRRGLRGEPYTLITATSAQEGLAVLQNTPCQVVLSDEKMPGMAGTAFLSLVRQSYPDTVRIMLTGHATLDAALRAVNEGEIYRFFSKPWDDLSVKFAIRSALEKHHLEAKNRALLSAVPDSMFRLHRDGTCLDYHAPCDASLALPPESVLGRTLRELVPEDLRQVALGQLQQALDSGELRLWEFSCQLAGTLRRFEARMVPMGPDEVLTMVRDVTACSNALAALEVNQKNLVELNRTLETRVQEESAKNREKDRVLAHQDRLAAMGEMVASIAHQWRQPLTAVSSQVQTLRALAEAGRLSPGDLGPVVEASLCQIRFMSDTIDELRNFFRPEQDKERFDLKGVVEQALRIVDPHLEELGIRTELSAAGSTRYLVEGFPIHFKQVIVNLLNNACQAIEERGPGASAPAGRIELTLEKRDGVLRTSICDNGCGISEQNRARIFAPYFTTRVERGGTGMGLYMSKMIIESSMGGRLFLQEVQGGTCFVIELPEGGGA